MWWWLAIGVLVFGGPYLSVWWQRRQKERRFLSARMAELSNAHDSLARFQLGQMYLSHNSGRKARDYLEEALKIQQDKDIVDPRLLDALGDAYLLLGELSLSESSYLRSLELDASGGQGDVYLRLGTVYQRQGRLEQALLWLQKACDANRSLAEPVFRLACVKHRTGEQTQARKLLDEFLPGAHQVPAFVRGRNRRWVWLMRCFPLSARLG